MFERFTMPISRVTHFPLYRRAISYPSIDEDCQPLSEADALPLPTSATYTKSDRGTQVEPNFVLPGYAGVPKRRLVENCFL
jgi:hypothetical protein